jgi:peroxiredoxin
MKRLEAATNIVIVCVALLAGYVLIRDHMPRSLPPQVKVGERLKIAGVDWSTHRQTLVFALQTGCRYCAESAQFYSDAVTKLRAANVHSLAILPQPIAESAVYFKHLNVQIEDVRQGSLGDLKVRATPTLMLVDRSGMIKNVWVGRLSPDGENDVLRAAGLTN